ncbi:MAG: hypothetical protein KKF33_09090 [Alphaproteobacteria bacterium]|nr:hypothetical protein [Alphaproteobacteria bacterium]
MDKLLELLGVRFDARPRPTWLRKLRLPIIIALAIVSWMLVIGAAFGFYLLVRQFI